MIVTAKIEKLENGKLVLKPDVDISRFLAQKRPRRVEVRLDDGRTISADQRRKIFAIMIRILLSKRLGELKWTQADLARATGIRPTTISDYYNEIAERMNLNHLDLICEALDCSPTEILVREPNPEPRVRNRTGFEKPVADQRKDGE